MITVANTRRFDRIIEIAERKLAAVENRELWALEGSDLRAIVRAGAVGAVKVARHKNYAKQDRTIETTWSTAAARLRAEITAAQKAKQALINDSAAARVAKKSSGWR